ncbi:MAG: helix-turn-helix domain-containing protein [Xanthomonadales bacterium]|nr:helix-turn-helix domain-containing protein [Xanthomonadales bacterium]
MRHLCLPAGVQRDELSQLEQRVMKSAPVEPGRFLFHAGEESRSVYVVRFGSFKSLHVSASGEEQIVGVHLPGEVFGLDGIATQKHALDAVALEKSGVCSISFDQIDAIMKELPNLQHQIMSMMSRELGEQQSHQVLMGRRSAVERVAMFLLRYSERLELRGFVGESFALALSRQDLANYLGLKIETVSRTFGKLRDQKLIEVDRRLIVILDFDGLRNAAGLEDDEAACF